MKRNLFVLILPLLLAGCAHTVGYSLNENDRWTGPKINGVVCVQPVVDHTLVTNLAWAPQEEHISNEVWRINSRGRYEQTNLTANVTAIIAKHLAYSGLFTKVVSGPDTNADYFLTGTLVDFQTRARANTKAEGIEVASGAAFGLVGALIGSASTSGMKSEIKTLVKLDDLKLTDRPGQIVWHDSICISNDVLVSYEEADPYVIYNRPDEALKEAVNEMIRRLGNSSLTNRTNSSESLSLPKSK